MTITVSIEQPRQSELLELMRQGDEFTLALYPPESAHLLGVEELEAPGVTVFVARATTPSGHGGAVGMTALVADPAGVGELKRMFVPPEQRGRGIATALVARLEEFAAASGIHTIRLETGPLQPAAIALYERCGYTLIANFGKYAGDPNSVCYEKTLA